MRGRVIKGATVKLALLMTVVAFLVLQSLDTTTYTTAIASMNTTAANTTSPASNTPTNTTTAPPSQPVLLTHDLTNEVHQTLNKARNTSQDITKANIINNKSNASTHNIKIISTPTRNNGSLQTSQETGTTGNSGSLISQETDKNEDDYSIQLMEDDGKDSMMDAYWTTLKVMLTKGTHLSNMNLPDAAFTFKDHHENYLSHSEDDNVDWKGRGTKKKLNYNQAKYKPNFPKTRLSGKFNEYKIKNNGEDSELVTKETSKSSSERQTTVHEIPPQSNHKLKEHIPYMNKNSSHPRRATQSKTKTPLATKPQLRTCHLRVQLDPCECERNVISRLPECPGPDMTQQQVLSYINTTLGESTCSDWATLRGTNQSVISYSLFGVFPSDYFRGAAQLAHDVPQSYPGWSMRFYHDLNLAVPRHKAWLCDLACRHPHLDLCYVANLTGGLGDLRRSIGTVWRLGVMGDRLVQRYLMRDTDSPVLQREVDAVGEWLRSGKCFHMMRDNPAHDLEILAGLWGGCGWWHREAIPSYRDKLLGWSHWKSSPLSYDQHSLVLLLWPLMRKSLLSHDSYTCRHYPSTSPFPTRRQNLTFVGMRSYRKEFTRDQIPMPCPARCRPKEHKNWTYC